MTGPEKARLIDDFLAQRCAFGDGYEVPVTDLHEALREFARQAHGPKQQVPNAAELGRYLTTRGFKLRRTGTARLRTGLVLKGKGVQMTMAVPDVPIHDAHGRPVFPGEILSPSVRQWCKRVIDEYPSLSEHHHRILFLAAQQWDRAQACADVLMRFGLVDDTKATPKERPQVAIERQAANAFRTLVRELGIDLEPTGGSGGRHKNGSGPPRIQPQRKGR